jgi:hypothetical protein
MAQDTLELKRSIESTFSLLDTMCFRTMPNAFPAHIFSASSFRWAVGIAISRCIPSSAIPGLNPALGLVLPAGLDFANHDDSVRLQFAAGARGGVALIADRNYKTGDQIFTTYGPKSNAQMMMSMGFTRENILHPYNSADILMTLQPTDPLRRGKSALLQRVGLAPCMRFRVPAAEPLIRRGLASRAPPLQKKNDIPRADIRAVEVEGEDEIVASWEQVFPFIRLSILTHAHAQRLGIALEPDTSLNQGGRDADVEVCLLYILLHLKTIRQQITNCFEYNMRIGGRGGVGEAVAALGCASRAAGLPTFYHL